MSAASIRWRTGALLAIPVATAVSLAACNAEVYDGTKAGTVPLAEVRGLALPETEQSPMGELAGRLLVELDSANDGVAFAPAWDDGTPDATKEADLAAAVAKGDHDFALIPARAFDRWPDASLPGLSTPFVLHSMEQAASVAMDPAVAAYLGRLEGAGLVGIAVMPENLRHPAATEALVEPDQFDGLRVRTIQADATFEASVLRELGASTVSGAAMNAVTAGDADAAETSFSWLPTIAGELTITGDLDLWVKFDVLVANPAAWRSLSDAQQQAVRDAATHVADHPAAEAEAANLACVLGHRVVIAGQAAREAFVARTSRIVRSLLEDTDHAAVVRAMQEAATALPAAEFDLPDLCRPPTGDAARPDD